MRKAVKIVHSLAACGMIGALLAYMVLLLYAPQDTAARYADMRAAINAVCKIILLPSLGVVLFSGLISMVVHRPFMDLGWVWLKAATGILLFEATLGAINAKADYAAKIAAKIAAGEADPGLLTTALATEWGGLYGITALSVANVVLGVWRPPLSRQAFGLRGSTTA